MAPKTKGSSQTKNSALKLKYAGGGVLFVLVVLAWLLFRTIPLKTSEAYVYFDKNDTPDSVYMKLGKYTGGIDVTLFKVLSKVTGVEKEVRVGYYGLNNTTMFSFFRRYRNHQQSDIKLKINNTVRTIPELAEMLDNQLMLSVEEIEDSLSSPSFCTRYGFTPESVIAVFLPNTYKFYWDVSMDKLMLRMKKEYEAFWTKARKAKAKQLALSPVEIITIASIVDEETSYVPEKSAVAGMYINRLKKPMRLQADPTVKYAVGDFSLRRILSVHLQVDDPYNTYRNDGLPPGPIRIPSIATIDAVLNRDKHNYLYMCAKEDFSGAHNFAVTYEEHLKNAERYRKALDARGIK